MLPCEPYRERLLDHLYGLLDPAEAADLDAHLAGCPDCAAARTEAARVQGLFARAARSEFPDVVFTAPAEPASPSERNHRPQPSPVEPPAPVRVTVRSAWARWVIAATLLLAAAGVGGPATRDVVGFLFYKPAVVRTMTEVERADELRKQRSAELRTAQADALRKKNEAEAEYAKLVEEWLKREEQAISAAGAQPFVVTVTGPSSALPGAPNEYTIDVKEKGLPVRPKPVALEAQVRDRDGKVLFDRKFPDTAKTALKLPASMWDGVKPGTDLVLTVTATDAGGARAQMTEQVRLLEPVYTTFLTTDKPMYRPGETVYFRTLTLDRTRFLPPGRDLNLQIDIIWPDGNTEIASQRVIGVATPTRDGRPIAGPDGRPVRGVGTGAFVLGNKYPGGEYRIRVRELQPNEAQATGTSKVIAERKFVVNNYTPDRLEKTLEFDARTYGPGDVVQAKVEVKDQSKPVAGAKLSYEVTAVYVTNETVTVTPDVAPPQTDAAGAAAVRFTLPKESELRSVTFGVRVESNGVRETLVRAVPLADRVLDMEFFPEGGDLLAGVENRVYFRATKRTDGRPADVSGVLTDGARTVCEVKTLTDPDHPGVNQGLGLFTFTPQPGKRYFVKLDRPLGVVQPSPVGMLVGAAAALPQAGYALPRANAAGVVLTVPDGVTAPGDPLRVRLASAGAKRTLLVGVYTRGRPAAHARAIVEPGKPAEVTLDFGGATLGGVTRITVFEVPAGDEPGRDDLKPVAERLVYRRPGEALKIGYSTAVDGKPEPGPFLPGTPVELNVTTYDETGRPKPAVLWAAVVNQSVLAMADEKAARLLPTHFLIGGEIRKPDELEHADFLLTEHPKAAAGLDLLLGTQGWRRFVEQGPEFRQRVPAGDVDRLLVAMGGGRAVPAGWRSGVHKVFEDFWPKYEAASLALDRAERDYGKGEGDAVKPVLAARDQAEGEYGARLTAFGSAAADLSTFDKGMEDRKTWLPATCIFLFGVGGLMLLVRYFRPAGSPERKPLAVGGVGFLALGLIAILAALTSELGGSRWKALAVSAPKPTTAYPYARPSPPPVADVQPPVRKDRVRLPGADDVPPGLRNQKTPVKPPDDVPPENGADAVPEPVGPRAANAPDAPPVDRPGMPASRRRLNQELSALVQKAAKNGVQASALARNAQSAIEKSLPQNPGLVVREYAHVRQNYQANAPRTDFTETLLWQPVLVTPAGGAATVKFDLGDSINGYRVLIAGHTLDGRLGAVTGTIEVRKPLVVEPKLPQEIGSADKLDVPFVVSNGTAEQRTATLELGLTGLAVEGAGDKLSAKVPAHGGVRKVVRLVPDRPEGPAAVKVSADADGIKDAVERRLTMVPDGYPVEGGVSETLVKQAKATLALPPRWDRGTMKAAVTVYPNTLAELQAGLEGLLREPHGCFEQSSTANYPNVLITNYLKDSGQANPDLSKRTHDLMDRGYTKLAGFECPKTGGTTKLGYEWFGSADRPHEALTAYGLMQFTDMSKVYPVDPVMLKRTRQYLIDCRDGRGGFKRNAAAVDQFGRAPDHVTNAYIAWAVTEADRGTADPADLTRELDALYKQATDSGGEAARDPYFLALVANALLNRDRQADGLALLKAVAGMQAPDGGVPGAKTSITMSGGHALVIETTALAVLGWLKANRPDQFHANAASAMKYVLGRRLGGSFGSTQSTVLALKALVEYAKANRRPAESGEVRVTVGGKQIGAKAFTTESTGPVVVEIPEDALKPGDNEVRVETTAKEPYPLSVAWACRTRRPAAAADCAVTLAAKLAKTDVVEGDVVRLDVSVTNRKAAPQGMVVAVVGIPAGLKLPEDMKQMVALTNRPADGAEPRVSHWETKGRELVLYWRGMTPNQSVSVALDLVADVPGEYRGPAGRAYLYYDADSKCWVEPLEVKIRAK